MFLREIEELGYSIFTMLKFKMLKTLSFVPNTTK